jgi:ubiquinone/menaquinone biosynthesis C-methylase UbiE
MRAGPNVDIVSKSEYMPFGPVTFDVVTCLEMLEHDATPETTISEISRVLKPGGTVVITLPGIGFPKHEYPCDYWRVTTEGLTLWMWRFREVVVTEDKTHVYGTGRKA